MKRKLTKEQEQKIKLASQAGLAFGGIDDEGDVNFIGTVAEWNRFNKLTK